MQFDKQMILHDTVDMMQRPIVEKKIVEMIETFKSTGDDVVTHFIICSAVLKDDKIEQIQDLEFVSIFLI